jgi:hypothetical protein
MMHLRAFLFIFQRKECVVVAGLLAAEITAARQQERQIVELKAANESVAASETQGNIRVMRRTW